MEPSQSQGEAVPAGSASSSLMPQPGCQFTGRERVAASPERGVAKLLKSAPAPWKGAIAKSFANKAIAAGSGLPSSDTEEWDPSKKHKLVTRWNVGNTYAACGVLDLTCRVVGLMLWNYRYSRSDTRWPSVSDTQREDIGQAILFSDLMRLVFTGSSVVIRCTANLVILWHVFEHLRPSWKSGERKMKDMVSPFRMLLVTWVVCDFLQGCWPNYHDPTYRGYCTYHEFFHQVAMYACASTNAMLLTILYHDRDAGTVDVGAGSWILILMGFCLAFYTSYLVKKKSGHTTPMGWALVVEVSFLMFNVGRALPPRIFAVRGNLGMKWYPRFLRDGKVREGEDTSARTGSKKLLLSAPEPDDEGLPLLLRGDDGLEGGALEAPKAKGSTYAAERKNRKKQKVPEDELLSRQRAELAALNAQIGAKAPAETPEPAAADAAVSGGGAKAPAQKYKQMRTAQIGAKAPVQTSEPAAAAAAPVEADTAPQTELPASSSTMPAAAAAYAP